MFRVLLSYRDDGWHTLLEHPGCIKHSAIASQGNREVDLLVLTSLTIRCPELQPVLP